MTVSHLIEMLTKLNPKTEITVWINGCDYNCDKEFDFEGDYVGDENDGYSLEVKPQESEKINCKSTKCENCINHNYCDYEPQKSEVKE